MRCGTKAAAQGTAEKRARIITSCHKCAVMKETRADEEKRKTAENWKRREELEAWQETGYKRRTMARDTLREGNEAEAERGE